jgi:hypothetical protein
VRSREHRPRERYKRGERDDREPDQREGRDDQGDQHRPENTGVAIHSI